jgi:short-subunit dehydrogenase
LLLTKIIIGITRLINASSLAGLKTFPRLGVYNGSKFVVEVLTDALTMELSGRGDGGCDRAGPGEHAPVRPLD